MKKWLNHEFSSGPYTGEDFKQFNRDFRTTLKRKIKPYPLEIRNWNRGHYYLSGFLYNQETEKYVYFSISDVRPKANLNNILIRTAKNEKDYTGGMNNFVTLEEIGEAANRLTTNKDRITAN